MCHDVRKSQILSLTITLGTSIFRRSRINYPSHRHRVIYVTIIRIEPLIATEIDKELKMTISKHLKKAKLASKVLLATVCLVSVSLYAQKSTSKILKACEKKRGLCVVVGVESDTAARLAADLARGGDLLVHGLALSDKSLVNTRKIVSENKVDGLVSIEKLSLDPFPYRDNLVNIIIVPDLATAKKAGFTKKEALRVLAPFGELYVVDGNGLSITKQKIRPGMDEWTHNMHGPDGNRASKDTVVSFPVGFRWHAGLPFNINNRKRQGNRYSSTRGMAITNGRCFTFSDSVIDNLKPAYFLGQKLDQYVTARDAFSGLLLWRKKIGKVYYGGLWQMNMAPFVAVGDYVYTVSEDGQLLVIDAANGETAKTIKTDFPPGRLLVDDGVLVAANWKGGTNVGESLMNCYERIRMESGVDMGDLEAYDVATGKPLWRRDGIATTICSNDGALYFVQRSGKDLLDEQRRARPKKRESTTDQSEKPKVNDRGEQSVVAVDLKSGKELWSVSAKELMPDGSKTDHLRVDAAGSGAVSVIHSQNRAEKVSILSSKTGKVILQKKSGELPLFIDGAIHFMGKKYNPETGAVIGSTSARVWSTICTPSYYVNGMCVKNRMGNFSINGKSVRYGGARGGCGFGSTPAYGTFYTPQNWCTCAPSQISGFICFGPVKHVPTSEELKKAPIAEKGNAYGGKQGAPTPKGAEWPMRGFGETRGNATPATAPDKLERLWNTKITNDKKNGLVSRSWKEYLNPCLTGPTIGDGIVATAAMDMNQVVGISLKDGKIIWRYRIGARIDSSPTFYRGICLFGAHDGYLYAIDAKSGILNWKLRMAPNSERMVSYGKVESPWPVIGSVLVSDGIVYASAGRTQGSDGGVIVRAIAPKTGKVIWSKVIGAEKDFRSMRRNDLILKVNGALQIMQTRVNPANGEVVENPTFATNKYYSRLQNLKRYIARWKSSIKAKKNIEYSKKVLAKCEKQLEELKKPENEIAFHLGQNGTGSEGLINWNWPRLGNRKIRQLNYGNLGGELICWDKKSAFNTRSGRVVFCYSIDKIGKAREKLLEKPDWLKQLPAGYQITDMALCANAVVLSGGIYNTSKPDEVKGFVYVVSRDKGEKIAEHIFPAAVVFNGLAIVEKKICVALENGSISLLGQNAGLKQ
jgi:outer membrane protein assembly factor BamB